MFSKRFLENIIILFKDLRTSEFQKKGMNIILMDNTCCICNSSYIMETKSDGETKGHQ